MPIYILLFFFIWLYNFLIVTDASWLHFPTFNNILLMFNCNCRMAVKLLCLCLLLALLCPSWARKQTCLTSASSCDQCVQSGPECAWCTAPDSDVRCHSMKGLRRAGCPKRHIYNPQGLVQVVKNESRYVFKILCETTQGKKKTCIKLCWYKCCYFMLVTPEPLQHRTSRCQDPVPSAPGVLRPFEAGCEPDFPSNYHHADRAACPRADDRHHQCAGGSQHHTQ